LIYKILGLPPYIFRKRIEHYGNDIKDVFRYRKFPMFRCVVIETSSFCNRKCKFCPVSIAPRGKIFMDESIFNKIIKELSDINYQGAIYLHLYNEPLCDPKIVEKVRKTKLSVPKSQIKMNSNGDYLTRELLIELYNAGLDQLNLSIYGKKIPNHIQRITSEVNSHVKKILNIMIQDSLMGNRAGALKNVIITEPLRADCYSPSYDVVINYKGDYIICCEDYYGESALGNVKEIALMEIWNGKKYKYIRYLLRKKRRKEIPICKNCNSLGSIYGKHYLSAEEIKALNQKKKRGGFLDWNDFKIVRFL